MGEPCLKVPVQRFVDLDRGRRAAILTDNYEWFSDQILQGLRLPPALPSALRVHYADWRQRQRGTSPPHRQHRVRPRVLDNLSALAQHRGRGRGRLSEELTVLRRSQVGDLARTAAGAAPGAAPRRCPAATRSSRLGAKAPTTGPVHGELTGLALVDLFVRTGLSEFTRASPGTC